MQSKATTVRQYLEGLPPERRRAIEAVRKVILENLDKGFEEGMQYGMIGYYVPHRIFPAGYHCNPKQPLPFAGLASQKNYMSLYLMSGYGEGLEEKWFREQWAKTGKKLDMGKCCVRFKKLEDLALPVIGQAIRRVSTKKYVEQYQSFLKSMGQKKTAEKTSAGKSTKKTTARKSSTRARPAKSMKGLSRNR